MTENCRQNAPIRHSYLPLACAKGTQLYFAGRRRESSRRGEPHTDRRIVRPQKGRIRTDNMRCRMAVESPKWMTHPGWRASELERPHRPHKKLARHGQAFHLE